MNFAEYKECVRYTLFNNYPDYILEKLLKKLSDDEIIVNDKRISKDKIPEGIIDISLYTELREKISAIWQTKDNIVVKSVEEIEFKKAYRHAVIFNYSNFDVDILDKLIEDGSITEFGCEGTYDNVDFIAKKPTILRDKDKVMLKFSFLKKSIIEDEKIKPIKYIVQAVLYNDINVLEIRFDQIRGIFKSSEEFYKNMVMAIKAWLGRYLNINIDNIDFRPIVRKLTELYNANESSAEVIPLRRNMSLRTGSKVVLDIDANKNLVVPILGELKHLINDNIEEFKKSPNIHDLLLNFINGIEETADVPKARLLWRNMGILIGITHEYKDSSYSLFQYFGELKDSEMMEYVTRYLIEYRNIDEE